jgi:hypothetical protein
MCSKCFKDLAGKTVSEAPAAAAAEPAPVLTISKRVCYDIVDLIYSACTHARDALRTLAFILRAAPLGSVDRGAARRNILGGSFGRGRLVDG